MNKKFTTKVVSIILVFLLIFMGVSNYLLNDNNRELARIGKEVITFDEYQSLYQNYRKQISKSNLNEDQAKNIKYDLLNALIEQKLLFNLMNDLKLVVGEESIKDYIKNNKHFQNNNGEFDKEKFYETLNTLNITETEYVSKLRKTLPVVMFITSLFKDNYPMTFGKKVDKQVYRNRYQTRIVDVIRITKDAVTSIPKPENQILLDLYERDKHSFYYPEYRIVQYISLGQKHFRDRIQILDKEIDYIIEERELKNRRNIFNLVLSTKEEAEVIRKVLKEGKTSFEQIVEDYTKKKLYDIKMDNITKDFLPEGIGKEVFDLKIGEVSEVLRSSFGWHIIVVESAYQISDEDLANLKKDIKSILTSKKSFEEINDFISQVNYKIYNGATIEEISSEYNLSIERIGPVDSNGKDQNGNSIIESSNDLISFIFSQERYQRSYFKSIEDAIVCVKIIDIIKPKPRSFEESKELVEELWRESFIKKQMLKIAQKVVFLLKEKTDLEKSYGIEYIKDRRIQRNKKEDLKSYPSPFIEEVFNMSKADSVTKPIQYSDEIVIGVLKDIHSPDGELNIFDTGKKTMISLKEQLVSYLWSKYKIEINHAMLADI